MLNLEEGDRFMVIAINGSIEFQNYLLANGISLGTILAQNYSPNYTKLMNVSVGCKMLSFRLVDFKMIEFVKI